ncbi:MULTISPECIES: 1,4-dihydroxy-2-naphthoate polyprenyltransferase [Leifsonia]|uniref:1,4-dihydroxy-2-naphthoate octaprenyltransferase n=3 Tax=Leifsonia TaxID=110932 RepID=A0A7W4UW90_LEIAQ|nr:MULTISPECIES: 1,4-dihydroxy-2-naphthoate polyprenyltransferase [Leifsonia]MBB2967363.1 1,4-dihydroxy-2-naphthoate octaprenyltransferase [Leifsonia aquatica]NYK09609.1 1,4-dihydroxy-2-naphthoate octaprenyltransferase [Leifsonia naganoensis]
MSENKPRMQRMAPPPARGPRGGKSGRPGAARATAARPATAADWIAGARLRTLPLAIAPVLIGVGAAKVAEGPGVWHPVRSLLCLAVAVLLQIGVNYANDYSDGIRGTDEYRVGPGRLTGSGKAAPKKVLTVSLVFFGLAALAGLVLVILTQHWWILLIGAAAIAAAWFYTGGKRPYGYFGLGELFVFVFFGLVATAGTTFMLAGTVNQEAWYGAVVAGLIACAVLMVNNIRDIEPDKAARKRTLAVLIGNVASRIVFCVLLLVPFLIVALLALFYPIAWFGMFALLAALPACAITLFAKTSRELITALQLTSITGLLVGIALGVAFAF